jgi:hypothetical protein
MTILSACVWVCRLLDVELLRTARDLCLKARPAGPGVRYSPPAARPAAAS